MCGLGVYIVTIMENQMETEMEAGFRREVYQVSALDS